MAGRPWTPSELATLRRLRAEGRTAAEIAPAVGRTRKAVEQAVKTHALPTRKRARTDGEFDARLRAMHAAGRTDPEIAAALDCGRHTVSLRRRRLGLPSNRAADAYRRRVAAATRAQLDRAGLPTLAMVRVRAFRERAAAAGWPADVRPRAVQILEALMERGPMTRREIADAVGMPWKGSRKSLTSNDPEGSYLANLMGRGLVVCLGRVVRGAGKGRSVSLYSLALDVERGWDDGEQ